MQCFIASLLATRTPPGHGVNWTEHPTRYMYILCSVYTVYQYMAIKTEGQKHVYMYRYNATKGMLYMYSK